MLIPYSVDVPLDRKPLMNWVLIALTTVAFVLQITAPDAETVTRYVLDGWTITGLLGHMFLHADLFHLGGNMLFLWVFGNAVCAKIGNLAYVPVFVFYGLLAAIAHLLFSGEPMIGASGAINGVVGMFMILYGLNDINCFFFIWIFHPIAKTFSVSSFWMILYWLAFDILGAVVGGDGIAYFAHLGGFAGGIILAVVLLKTNMVKMQSDEKSLVEVWDQWRQDSLKERLQRQASAHFEKAKQQEPAGPPRRIPVPPAAKQKEEMIRFLCPCGQRIKVPLVMAGKEGKCPGCRHRIVVPSLSGEGQ